MTQTLDIEDQRNWKHIYNNCASSAEWICDKYKFNPRQFMKWVHGEVTPRPKNHERMVKAMGKLINDDKKLEYHPSYGYATPEQIKELNEIGIGMRRDLILKKIEIQTKTQGKKR